MQAAHSRLPRIIVILGLVIAGTLALFAVENETAIAALWGGSKYPEIENRLPAEPTPVCMWVDVKGPNGVRALQCVVLPDR